jgi:hypothetical protein
MNIELILLVIPILVPAILGWWRKFILLHFGKRAIPHAAIILGALCEIAITWMATGIPSATTSGAFLGLSGIGLREVLDQTKKKLKDWKEPPIND